MLHLRSLTCVKVRFLTRTRLQGTTDYVALNVFNSPAFKRGQHPHTISEASTMITACLVVDDLRKDYYHYGIRKLSPTSAGLPVSQTHAGILFIPTCTRLTDNASLVGTAPECSYDYLLRYYLPHSEPAQQNWQKPRRTCTSSQTGYAPVYNDKCLHAIVPASRSTFHHLEPTQQNWQK